MDWIFLLAIVCIIPAIASIILFKKINKKVQPFIWQCWLAVLTEIAYKLISIYGTQQTLHVLGNFYYSSETLLYLLFFYNTQTISSKKNLIWLITACYLFFITNWVFKNPFRYYAMYAYLLCSLIIIVLSVNLLSKEAWRTSIPVSKNGIFLIATGILIFATLSVLIETIEMLTIGDSNFNSQIYNVIRWTNPIVYLIDTYALICLATQKTLQ